MTSNQDMGIAGQNQPANAGEIDSSATDNGVKIILLGSQSFQVVTQYADLPVNPAVQSPVLLRSRQRFLDTCDRFKLTCPGDIQEIPFEISGWSASLRGGKNPVVVERPSR